MRAHACVDTSRQTERGRRHDQMCAAPRASIRVKGACVTVHSGLWVGRSCGLFGRVHAHVKILLFFPILWRLHKKLTLFVIGGCAQATGRADYRAKGRATTTAPLGKKRSFWAAPGNLLFFPRQGLAPFFSLICTCWF
ncbi:hypothetical protein TW95_gp0839 [Pandoravirus inopinatum]|uniref:Uncharacterized protein n=1 Tax=Pandoravirus inopinatum TaxID=1605721 RepID=A0A0B5IXQ4_9VIRU|nr:hypothetical protein TW95_gp0839 [Pandoravirus inopinatum]AJF97573.1 hypothetical protein [Pandoravirus inopinatum]